MFRAVIAAYRRRIAHRKREVAFWVLNAFVPTFLIARALVYLAPQFFLRVGDTHIHHFTWGILLLAVAGYLALTVQAERWRLRIAVLYGIGLALSFDEFGMWLHLQDGYWVRTSYDAVLVVFALLINAAYFDDFWLNLLRWLFGFKVGVR